MSDVSITDEQKNYMRYEIDWITARGEQLINKMNSNPIIVPFKENDDEKWGQDDIIRNRIRTIIVNLKNIEISDDIEVFRNDIQTIYEYSDEMYSFIQDIENHYYVRIEW